ncbi:MAG TPA: TetR/AcrR family transcriptional regulator [Burkholderiales bacterium]|jgi:TetR/AcrR family transcriptional regulator, mexJK operon transcriptional repressor|nr:TetR/AcrR family transcriptional regulator [Burkholderiales bacterium]
MAAIHRSRVLRAATSSFLARGYGSSVDDIARRARVAKQTVYQHFASKDELFKAVAEELAKRVLVELEGGDIRASLLRFGLAYRSRALGAQGIATFRTLVPEVPRFRALARTMYANTAGEMVRRLAGFLREKLEVEDAEFAAEMLLSMLTGHDRLKRLFAVPPGSESEAKRTERIVDTFLKAVQR